MNLFFILFLLIAAAAHPAEFETTVNGDRVNMYYEDGTYFQPKFTLYKWNEEESLTIEYSEAIFDKCEIEEDKYKAEADNMELEVFGLGNEFKMEITFQEKPDSNVLVFELTNWENFNFYYQPPLTQEDIDLGCYRPDDVVGSYAVYHKTKKHNNYKTGKAFHIYRPKFIDSVGNWTWVDLHIENGIYTVTIPQEFLDTCIYPIKANDTFGNTSSGDSDLGLDGYMHGSTFTSGVGESGTTSTIHCYTQDTNGSVMMAMYTDEPGQPQDKLGTEATESTPVAYTTSANVENYVADFTAETVYWLCFNTASNCDLRYDSSSGVDKWHDYGEQILPAEAHSSWGTGTRLMSIWVTYSGGEPPAAAPSVVPQIIILE